jgi:tetratricopeptide (TPR) repeat protein
VSRLRVVLACGAVALLAAAPLAAQASLERGQELFHAGRFAEARGTLSAIARAEPRNDAAAFWLGRAHFAAGEMDQAAEWFERAVKLQDGNGDYHLWVGRAYGGRAMNASPVRQPFLARKAKAAFERAIAVAPRNVEARFGLLQFRLMAPAVMGGSMDRAREQAEEIRRIDRAMGYRALAQIHAQQKDAAAAERVYLAAVRDFPDTIDFHVSLGLVYQEAGRHGDAFALMERLLQARPGLPAALYQIGRIGAVSGQRLDRAEAALLEYLAAPPPPEAPSHAAAQWRLGMIREKKGDPAGARAAFEAALRLDPKQRGAQDGLKRLASR